LFAAAVVLVLGLTVAVVGCSGDDDDASGAGAGRSTTSGSGSGSSTTVADPDALTSAGGAPAAQGAHLDEPPGPADRKLLDGFGEVAIAVRAPDGTVKGWCVLLAESATQRERGLMEVTDLKGYAGMLFVWDADASSQFYMRDTPMPLSIAWIAADGQLVSTAGMAPCGDVDNCPLYSAKGPYRFALETPSGQLDELGLVAGSVTSIGGSCAGSPPKA
jgi:uncharacterized membrane protein (UPF0127 family)